MAYKHLTTKREKHALSLQKHDLLRAIDAERDKKILKSLNAELIKINSDIEIELRKVIGEKMEEIHENEVVVNTEITVDKVKTELKRLDELYNGLIEQYREIIQALDANKIKKVELRDLRKKVYEIKKKKELSVEDKEFMKNLKY